MRQIQTSSMRGFINLLNDNKNIEGVKKVVCMMEFYNKMENRLSLYKQHILTAILHSQDGRNRQYGKYYPIDTLEYLDSQSYDWLEDKDFASVVKSLIRLQLVPRHMIDNEAGMEDVLELGRFIDGEVKKHRAGALSDCSEKVAVSRVIRELEIFFLAVDGEENVKRNIMFNALQKAYDATFTRISSRDDYMIENRGARIYSDSSYKDIVFFWIDADVDNVFHLTILGLKKLIEEVPYNCATSVITNLCDYLPTVESDNIRIVDLRPFLEKLLENDSYMVLEYNLLRREEVDAEIKKMLHYRLSENKQVLVVD